MLLRTPLLCAPSDEDPLGTPMLSADLIAGLRRANSDLVVPDPLAGTWMPAVGMSAVWLGPPFVPGSRKICALHLGAIPEWTQMAPDGRMITRGWRAVLEKVIKARAATRGRLEREFRVDLTYGGHPDLCTACVRSGTRQKHNGGARHLCDFHESARVAAERAIAEREENELKARWRKRRTYVC